jgi:hypothetical protein
MRQSVTTLNWLSITSHLDLIGLQKIGRSIHPAASTHLMLVSVVYSVLLAAARFESRIIFTRTEVDADYFIVLPTTASKS